MSFSNEERDMLIYASDFNDFSSSNNTHNEFKKLFYNYAKRIISRQFCWNHDLEPEDLLQETFIKALKNEEKYEQGTDLKNWVYAIMLNINRDYKKKYNYEVSVTPEDLTKSIDIPTDKKINNKPIFDNNDHLNESKERVKIIYEVIKNLSQVEREIVISIHVNDLTSVEVAEIMKMPSTTVRTILARTNKKIKEMVNRKIKQ